MSRTIRTLGTAELGMRGLASLAQIGADRLTAGTSRALPDRPEDLADAETLNRILSASARRPGAMERLPTIAEARLAGVEFESSNCRNFLIEVEYVDPAEAKRLAAPRTLYAKMPCEEIGTRVFANALGFWPLEVIFCQRLAARIPIRVPRVYAAEQRGSRFVLLLENLHEDPETQLFLNRDMAAGTTPERAERVLHAFARMHAHFHGLDPARREIMLPERFNTYTANRWRRVTRALNAMALAPARRAAPELISQTLVETCRLALDRWDRVLEAWYSGPLTLVHGDSHLGNCFEHTVEGRTEVGMIDFQAVHWSKGVRDVQYFLINSMDPDRLATHEESLLRGYCAALAEHGVTLPYEQAFEQYRAFSYQTLMVGIVPLGLGALTERDETVLAVTRRSTQAVERLGFRDWVEHL
jgi:aminoglycoside phosphotransferase (APT) family kinase protein